MGKLKIMNANVISLNNPKNKVLLAGNSTYDILYCSLAQINKNS